MQLCPNCGEENPDRFRLCGFCGTPLSQGSNAESVRKTVTILFCDLKGSTSLGEKIDPEALSEVLALYFNEMRAVIERHGGKVEKYIGDAIVAVFGLPRAHEDDALRAVRAATDMMRALERTNEIIEARWDVRLQNRTGVNTGEVIAGDASMSQHLVTGDAVNTAARLEQNAPTDQVLIGEPTYRLVKDAIEAEPVQPLALKGKAERVPAYRLIAVNSDEAIVRHLDSPLVGRTKELAILNGAFESAESGQAAHIATVFGPPGAGKSRLLREFLNGIGDRAVFVHGRCLSYGEGITYWPLGEIVRGVCGITDDDNLQQALSKVRAFIPHEDVADRIASAIGISHTPFSVNEMNWAASRFFGQLACIKPLVAVIDDIHWAEPAFLDLLRSVVRSLTQAPILLLCSSRPELFEEQKDWGEGDREAAIVLEALTAEESSSVIDNILGHAAIDERARDRIIHAAEGNPLFVEQMIRMLVEDGVIEQNAAGRWELVRDLDSFAIPGSVSALITARLDRLTPAEQSVVQRAAVIGQQFFRDAIEHLLPDGARNALDPALETLSEKGLIAENAVSFAGLRTYRFQHILIRDAAYRGMLKRTRAELHEQFVDWVEGANPDRVMEFEEIRGYHLEQAYLILGNLGPLNDHAVRLGQRASQHLAATGRRAVTRADMHAAANLLQRAAVLLPTEDPVRLRLTIEAAEALFEIGDFATADTCLLRALVEAESIEDVALETTVRVVRLQLRFLAEGEGHEDSLIDSAREAIETLTAEGDYSGLARAWRLLAYVHGTACRWAAAEEAIESTIKYARLAGDEMMARRLLPRATTCLLYGPTPVPLLIDRCQEVLAEAGDDRKTRALTLRTIAIAQAMRGDFATARDLYRSSRAILEELGLTLQAALISLVSGPIETAAGDLAAAEAELRRDYEALDAMGERNYISTTAACLADVLYRQRRYDESMGFTEISEKIAASDDLTSQFMWRSVRGKLLAQEGRLDEALELASASVEMVRRTDERNSQAEALVGLAEVLELSGCDEDAIVAVEEASELFQMKGNVVGAAEALSIEQRVRAKSGRDPSVVIDITDGVPNRDIDRAARNMS